MRMYLSVTPGGWCAAVAVGEARQRPAVAAEGRLPALLPVRALSSPRGIGPAVSRAATGEPSPEPRGRQATLRPGLRPEGVALRAVRLTASAQAGTFGAWLMTSPRGTAT